MSITAEVANGMRIKIMLAAVNLNNQPLAQANEVENATVTRRLSAEVITALSP